MEVLTIGHSILSYERFVIMLRAFGVTAVADVRSSPFSRHVPHFDRGVLQSELKADGMAYVFLGTELGGRPKGRELFRNGVADYEKMARVPSFEVGLNRVVKGAVDHRIALMCSEHDPLDCHRCLLVGRSLKAKSVQVCHILSEKRSITQDNIEDALLAKMKKSSDDMFISRECRVADAYNHRANRVAFAEERLNKIAAAE